MLRDYRPYKGVHVTIEADPGGEITLDEAIAAAHGAIAPPDTASGIGVVIRAPEGPRVLTCQHIARATVGAKATVNSHPSRVLAVSDVEGDGGASIDLALLEVPPEVLAAVPVLEICRKFPSVKPRENLLMLRPDQVYGVPADGYGDRLGWYTVRLPPGVVKGWSGTALINRGAPPEVVGILWGWPNKDDRSVGTIIGPRAIRAFVLGRTEEDPDGVEMGSLEEDRLIEEAASVLEQSEETEEGEHPDTPDSDEVEGS